VEIQVVVLEKKKSPRPILKLIGPTSFSADWEVGGRGATNFFGGRGDPLALIEKGRVGDRAEGKVTYFIL
jgi:hypothetical protein